MNSFDFSVLGSLAGTRVLDLGAGGGRHAIVAALAGAEVFCVDLDVGVLASVGENAAASEELAALQPGTLTGRIRLVRADARFLPFSEATFDVVIASEVFEHISRDGLAMAEVARVLRSAGVAAISVPRALPEVINWGLSKAYHSVAGGHVRIYTQAGLRRRLGYAGLEVFYHHYAHGSHAPYWWLKCAVGVENDAHPWAKRYEAALVDQIMGKAPRLDWLDARILNPAVGKSLVVYARVVACPVGEGGPGHAR